MPVDTDEHTDGAIESYRAALTDSGRAPGPHRRPGFDELVGAEGVHPEDEALARAIDDLGTAGLRSRARQARRFVRSDGVTYGATTDDAQPRPWAIDPLPVIVTPEQWAGLEAGLAQRARLLDLVLQDLYGERRLLAGRVVPAEVVLGHPGFVRQADGIRLPGPAQLVLAATDVARAADGSWTVFGDRTEAPPGAGYAMATRRIVSRTLPSVHRGTGTRRLRGFFHTLGAALLDAAPRGADSPKVVVLAPGAASRTAFDQAFLATLLGFPLVEGEDLTTKDGRVWLRAPGQEQPVDVVLRRVAADWADPLELNNGSRLGVPGLIECARRGQVSVVNPMGAAVLENPGLTAFLPQACRALLGEDLALPQPESFWCGDERSRSHVVAHLRELVLKPLGGDAEGTGTRFGWLLSDAQAQEMRARIETSPWAWCAQEPLPESTAPVVTPGGLEPRRLVLRTFVVNHAGQAHVMPGALGRVAGDTEQDVVSDRAGSLAKDVWVLADPSAQAAADHPERAEAQVSGPAPAAGVAPRMADDLFWVGRYTERVEGMARVLRVADDLTGDYASRAGSLGALAMSSMQHAATMTTAVPSRVGPDGRHDPAAADRWQDEPAEHARRLLLEAATPGTVAHGAGRLVRAARGVRDLLSLDTWPVLSRLQDTLAGAGDDDSNQELLARVLDSTLALGGIVQQGMIRDESWAFLDAGTRLERAQLTVALLRSTLAIDLSPVIEGQVVESVLLAGESLITYRRRTAAGEGPSVPAQAALHLLLQDRTNPRSVAFQADGLVDDLTLLGDEDAAALARRQGERVAGLDLERLARPGRAGLARTLGDLDAGLRELADDVAARHFRRKGTQSSPPVEWTLARENGRA